MSTDQRIRIELTPEQKNQVKEASGKEIATISGSTSSSSALPRAIST